MVAEGGFNFDLCKRNAFLEKQGVSPPGFTKTGTTIAGVVFKVSDTYVKVPPPVLLGAKVCCM